MMVYTGKPAFAASEFLQAINCLYNSGWRISVGTSIFSAVRDLRSDLPEEDAASPPETDNVRTAFCFRNAETEKPSFSV